MPTDNNNLWIMAILFIVLVVMINLLAWARAHGARGFKGEDLFIFRNATKPWKKEEDNLHELHQRVQDLKSKQDDEET